MIERIVGYTYKFNDKRAGYSLGAVLVCRDENPIILKRTQSSLHAGAVTYWKKMDEEVLADLVAEGTAILFDQPLPFPGEVVSLTTDTIQSFDMFAELLQEESAILHASNATEHFGLLVDVSKLAIPVIKLYASFTDILRRATEQGMSTHCDLIEIVLKELRELFPVDDYVHLAETRTTVLN